MCGFLGESVLGEKRGFQTPEANLFTLDGWRGYLGVSEE